MIGDVHAHCWPAGWFIDDFIADASRRRVSVAGLRSLAQVKLDRFWLPAEQIQRLIDRDALALWGLSDFLARANNRRRA